MNSLTWHTEYAKVVLNKWYADWEKLLELAELATLKSKSPINKEASKQYKRHAIHCKTAGLVWHDRYALLLDGCWRKTK